MIQDLAGGDPTKFDWVAENMDVDDFMLWLAFKNRDSAIEEWIIKNHNNE